MEPRIEQHYAATLLQLVVDEMRAQFDRSTSKGFPPSGKAVGQMQRSRVMPQRLRCRFRNSKTPPPSSHQAAATLTEVPALRLCKTEQPSA
jgi:hypothetical protein